MPRVTQECDFTIHEDEPSVCSSAGGDEGGTGGRESMGEGEESYIEEPAADGVADDGADQPGEAPESAPHEDDEVDASADHTEHGDEQTPTEAPDDTSQADTTKADDEPMSGRQSASSSSSRRMSGRTDALIQAAAKAVVARIEKRRSSPEQAEAGEDEEEPEFSTLSFNTEGEGERVENESYIENEDHVEHQGHAEQDYSENKDHIEQGDQTLEDHAEQGHVEDEGQGHSEQQASTRGPSPHAPSPDDAGADSSSHNGDDDVFSDRSPRSSSGSLGSLPSDSEHKSSSPTETGTPHARSPRISNMSSYDGDEDFIPASRSTPRPPFRSPSSVRAMQMASPPGSAYGSARSSRSFNRLGSPVQYSPKGRSTPSRLKAQREPPLVLLHVTLLPLAWPWAGVVEAAGQEELSEEAGSLRDAWRQLQSKMGDTVVERGVLLPHPQNDFEMLEERVLESLELPLKRRARILECGHYLGPSNVMAVEDSGSESDEQDGDSEGEGSSPRMSKRGETHWCKTCRHEIRCEAMGPGRVFRVKVYASNGLMKAGAWEACWKEMERVDVEIEPWVEAGVQGELGGLAAEQERRAEEAYLEQEKRDEEAYLEQQKREEEAYLERERREQEAYLEREREVYMDQDAEYEVGGDGPMGTGHDMEEQSTMAEPEPDLPSSHAPSQTPARHSTDSNDRSLLSPDQHALDDTSPEPQGQEQSTSVISRGSTDVIPAAADHEMQLEERNVVAEQDAHMPDMPASPPPGDAVDERALPEAQVPHLLEESPNAETQIEQRGHSSISHHDAGMSSPRDSHLQIEDGEHAALEDTPGPPAIEGRSHSSISRRDAMDSPRNSLHSADIPSPPAIEQRSHSSISRHDQLSAPLNQLQLEDRRRSADARSSAGDRDPPHHDTERRRRDEERLREIYGHAPPRRSPSPEVRRESYAPEGGRGYERGASQLGYERREEGQGYRESGQYEREVRHGEFDRRERGRAYKDASLPELLCEAAKVFLGDGKNLVILLLGGLVLILGVAVGGGGRGQEVLGRGQEVFERGQEMFARMEMPRMQVPRAEVPRMEMPRVENYQAEQVVPHRETETPVREPQTLTEREVVRVVETVTETVKVTTSTEQEVEVETARAAADAEVEAEAQVETQVESAPSESVVEPEVDVEAEVPDDPSLESAEEPLDPVDDTPAHEEL